MPHGISGLCFELEVGIFRRALLANVSRSVSILATHIGKAPVIIRDLDYNPGIVTERRIERSQIVLSVGRMALDSSKLLGFLAGMANSARVQVAYNADSEPCITGLCWGQKRWHTIADLEPFQSPAS